MSQAKFITIRCNASGGCGRWLVKIAPATLEVVKRNRGVQVRTFHDRPERRSADGRIMLDWPDDDSPSRVGPAPYRIREEVNCCGCRYELPRP